MTHHTASSPKVVSQSEWLEQRRQLLTQEKELTRQHDRISAQRRRLPMVKIEKEYLFDGPEGKRSLRALFGDCRQLIVYHFMFDPEWDKGCPGCTGYVDALGNLTLLNERDTNFVIISRAPLAKLEDYKISKGWRVPWYSSFGSDFNYDFHVTLDEHKAPVEYNYRTLAEMKQKQGENYSREGEEPGLSVFFRDEESVFHTYSSFARGVEALTDTYSLLDVTPYGRQEDWEDSPPGWPQKPTYG